MMDEVTKDLLETLKNVAEWIQGLPIPTTGATAKLKRIDAAIARAEAVLAEPQPDANSTPIEAIGRILAEKMGEAARNGANSRSMPDDYVAVAAWLSGVSTKEAPQPDAGLIGVQWWLAELDRYGNATLVDGKYSDRSGADQAMYIFKALNLDLATRYAVARVELSEPKPRGDGVNHEAIKTLNDARRETQP